MKRIAAICSLALALTVWPSVSAVATSSTVTVHIRGVRLFDVATVSGRISPAEPGQRVTVKLLRSGEPVMRALPKMDEEGRFVAHFRIGRPGWYRASASFNGEGLTNGSDVSEAVYPPLPHLELGDENVFVGLLERRLAALDYRIVGVGGRYTKHTADAVVAFHKVQGMDRVFDVSPATWRALADPVRPEPRFAEPSFHIEIDQTRQVLYTVRDGRIASISHVSTGKPSTPTYDGRFRVYRKVEGVYNSLYWPSYFDGGRAIHGWESVPTYPASHGCIRFPFWNAIWIYRQAVMGTVISIYH